jgi:hypothetical protein
MYQSLAGRGRIDVGIQYYGTTGIVGPMLSTAKVGMFLPFSSEERFLHLKGRTWLERANRRRKFGSDEPSILACEIRISIWTNILKTMSDIFDEIVRLKIPTCPDYFVTTITGVIRKGYSEPEEICWDLKGHR